MGALIGFIVGFFLAMVIDYFIDRPSVRLAAQPSDRKNRVELTSNPSQLVACLTCGGLNQRGDRNCRYCGRIINLRPRYSDPCFDSADSFAPETPEIGPGPDSDLETPMFDSAFSSGHDFIPAFDTPAPTQAMETPMFDSAFGKSGGFLPSAFGPPAKPKKPDSSWLGGLPPLSDFASADFASDFSPKTPEVGPGADSDFDTPMFDSAFGSPKKTDQKTRAIDDFDFLEMPDFSQTKKQPPLSDLDTAEELLRALESPTKPAEPKDDGDLRNLPPLSDFDSGAFQSDDHPELPDLTSVGSATASGNSTGSEVYATQREEVQDHLDQVKQEIVDRQTGDQSVVSEAIATSSAEIATSPEPKSIVELDRQDSQNYREQMLKAIESRKTASSLSDRFRSCP